MAPAAKRPLTLGFFEPAADMLYAYVLAARQSWRIALLMTRCVGDDLYGAVCPVVQSAIEGIRVPIRSEIPAP